MPSTLTVENGDIFTIEGTPDDSGDEYVHYEKDITNISSNTYTKYAVRYKTSVANNGLKPYISFQFTSGYQDVALPFSTRWKVTTGTITAAKTIDKVRLAATDDPNSLDSGTYQVYYDFLIICRNILTFPSAAPGGVKLVFPRKLAKIEVPGRYGDIIQNLGMNSPKIIIQGDMLSGETWGDATLTYGEIFARIMRSTDPWHWLSLTAGSEDIGFKVTPDVEGFTLDMDSEKKGAIMSYRLPFVVYGLSDFTDSTWDDLQWMGIT